MVKIIELFSFERNHDWSTSQSILTITSAQVDGSDTKSNLYPNESDQRLI